MRNITQNSRRRKNGVDKIDDETPVPTYMGYWRTGPTWFDIKRVYSHIQSLTAGGLFDNSI
eukprot:6915203-Prorocentrum_lima.AAC.1